MPEQRKVPIHYPGHFHQLSYYQPHPPVWRHHWPVYPSAMYPPSHDSPFFNPRAYDTVAPWAYETPIPSFEHPTGYHGTFDALSPIEREMLNEKYHLQRLFDGHHLFSCELNLHPSRPGSLLEHYSLMNPIRVDDEGKRWLSCFFDLRSYKPEEIVVTLNTKERYLGVEAAHEVNEIKEHYIKRHYSRKVAIPEDVKLEDLAKAEQLKAYLTNEGILCVEASLPKLALEKLFLKRSPSIDKAALIPPIDASKVPVKVF